MLRNVRDAGLLWPSLLALAGLCVLLGLGLWQWNRKTWKEDLIQTIAARSKAAPIAGDVWLRQACGTVAKDGLARSCEYLAVRLTGSFEHANERHVYTGIAKPEGGGMGGQGFWIMTPFKLSGSGELIAVSRGFVPEAAKQATARGAGQIQGEVTIVGLVREAESRATFTGANDPAKNMWYLRNPREIFAGQPVVARPDFFVDQLSPTPLGGLPQSTAGRIDIPNRHLEYALTWWGLAVTLIGVFVAFAAGRLKIPAKS